MICAALAIETSRSSLIPPNSTAIFIPAFSRRCESLSHCPILAQQKRCSSTLRRVRNVSGEFTCGVLMSAAGEIVNQKPAPQLRSGALNLVETVGQSLAAIAPTLTPALNISVVAGLAGLGCWLSYLIGTLGVVIVAGSVGVLASRHPEAGSYFVYIGRSFGPLAGALAGWSMISAYMFTAVAVTLSFGIFLGDFLAAFGVRLTMLPTALSMLVFVATVTYAAYRDIKLSSRVGLILEIISVGIMIVITAFFVHAKGTAIDLRHLKITSFHYGGVFSALPFVIFS